MKLDRGVYRWPGLDRAGFIDELRDEDWFIFTLPPEIVDKKSFFKATRDNLPLDPPLSQAGNDVWDGLSDSLWGGLYELDSDKIAIIWPNSAQMLRRDPEEFGIAVEVLHTTIDQLADSEMTVGHPKQVAVVLT